MKTLINTHSYNVGSASGTLPYHSDEINAVMIDFMMGQMPEQVVLSESDEYYETSDRLHSTDMFLEIFGEPETRKQYGDNYLLYFRLLDGKTLVISICAFACDIDRIHINDYFAC
ncbi:MAG: hypothetical protein GXY41_10060 [Phycisphaerae bacterium]|nr:hypothetical protein [Phycisphaerae bacterium]